MRRSAWVIAAAVVLQTTIYLTGCELAPNDPGTIRANQRPTVFFLNTFENVLDTIPDSYDTGFGIWYDTTVTIHANVVNYSSIISWYGTDKDGFIDHYEYAIEAIDDSVYRYGDGDPLSGNESYEDIEPVDIGEEDWITTTTTSDTVLFPAPTLQDRHRLWIRSVDDRGARSALKFADFVAVTEPPTVTLQCTDDDIEEGLCPADSVFSLGGITTTWDGITLSWEGEDPDGSIVAYIVKGEGIGDTITTETSITLTQLPAGDRTIYIYAMDNAGAFSPVPARRTFHVTVPTFDQGLLVVNDSDMDWAFLGSWPLNNDEFRAFYDSALETAGVTDVTWIDLHDAGSAPLTRELAGQYSNILWLSEQVGQFYLQFGPGGKMASRSDIIGEYLDAGGNLVFIGSIGSAMGDPADLVSLLDGRLGVSAAAAGATTTTLHPTGEAGFTTVPAYLYSGETLTNGGLYTPGVPFEDTGIDGYASSMTGNGIWDGGWAELLEFWCGGNNPLLASPGFTGGAFCQYQSGDCALGDKATILVENQNGDAIGVAVDKGTYRAVLLSFPLHFVLPVYHSADLGGDPYGSNPWDLLSGSAAESAAAVLRQSFTYTGILE